jgi:hypothetical protein
MIVDGPHPSPRAQLSQVLPQKAPGYIQPQLHPNFTGISIMGGVPAFPRVEVTTAVLFIIVIIVAVPFVSYSTKAGFIVL